MDENKFWILASKKIFGELTDEEEGELNLLFVTNPHHKEIYTNIQKIFANRSTASTESNKEILFNLRKKIGHIDENYAAPQSASDEEATPVRHLSRSFKLMIAASI